MTQMIEIRPYEPGDEAEVVALWDSIFPNDPPWNEPILVIRRKLTVQSELFFVAVVDGEVRGTVLAGFDGARGWIHHLGVHPDSRRMRVASRLVEQAVSALEALDCPKLNLQVRGGNETAVLFYESLGFEVEDRVSFGKRLGPWDAA